MLGFAIIFGLIAFLLGNIYYHQTLSRKAQKLNKFPGPKIVPILGNLLQMGSSPEKIFKILREFSAHYKTSYRIWMTKFAVINVITAEDAEIILTSNTHIKKSGFYKFLRKWLGTGLFTSSGRKWHHRRKLITPAFHFNILRKFAETFGEHAQILVEDLREECTKSQTSILPYTSRSTLHAICETAMGTSIDPMDKRQQHYIQSVRGLAPIIITRAMSPWLYTNFIFNLLPIGWRYNKLIHTLHDFSSNVIKEREANAKDSDLGSLDQIGEGNVIKKKKLAMLDLLLSAKKYGLIDDEGIREEVDTVMFGGHDTTSEAISLALMILANEKEHQDEVVQELDEIFGESERPATYEDLQKMTYLELCLKETLRIFPSAPLISRLIEEDLQLSTHIAPAFTTLNILIYDLHHDARYFPNPEKFDPSRFLPENSIGRHPFAYIPFSAGARNCIGQKFAMLELKSFVSAVLRNFVVEPVDTPESMKFKMDLVLRNDGDIKVRFRPRK